MDNYCELATARSDIGFPIIESRNRLTQIESSMISCYTHDFGIYRCHDRKPPFPLQRQCCMKELGCRWPPPDPFG